jgi:hypothetical protein
MSECRACLHDAAGGADVALPFAALTSPTIASASFLSREVSMCSALSYHRAHHITWRYLGSEIRWHVTLHCSARSCARVRPRTGGGESEMEVEPALQDETWSAGECTTWAMYKEYILEKNTLQKRKGDT